MFKEFNVKFEDAEIIGGADNLLEGTGVTKVILRGDNKLSSLDSTFKDCSQLDTVDGELDLNGISDIDSLLENSNLVTSIDLKNVNNKDITANNAFSHVNQINIGGETYNKEAIQNIISSREWTFNNINYIDTVGEDVVTHTPNISEEDENTQIVINDALEQKARNVEIKGQTYQNLIEGKEGAELLADIKFESIDGSPSELEPPIDHPVCVEVVEGQTYQNLIEGKGEYNLTDTYSATWTESNNSFEDIPDVVEIPEIFGNTFQGYINCLTAQNFVDMIKGTQWGKPSVVGENEVKFNSNAGSYYANNMKENMNNYPEEFCGYTLKANTTYTFVTYPFGSFNIATPTTTVQERNTNIKPSRSFTTDDTGRVIIRPVAPFNHIGVTMKMLLIEGEVDCEDANMDLNYIQSVGELYVDEEGSPILDDEGNEQYKLDVVSSNTLNLIDINEGCTNDGGEAYFNTVIDSSKVKKFTCIYKHNLLGHWFKPRAVSSKGVVGSVFINQQTTSSDIVSDGVYRIQFSVPSNVDRFVIQLSHFSGGNNIQVTVGHNTLPFLESVDTKQSNKTTILLPQQLKQLGTIKKYVQGVGDIYEKHYDTLYYDYNSKSYKLKKLKTKTIKASYMANTVGGRVQATLKTNSSNEEFVEILMGTYNDPILGISPWNGNGVNNIDSVICNCKNSLGIPVITYRKASIQIQEYAMIGFNVVASNYWSIYVVVRKEKYGNRELNIGGVRDFFNTYEFEFEYLCDLNSLNTLYETVEVKTLEKPISLETYSPTTYISTNTEIQPSKMNITNKRNVFVPLGLQANKDYTLQLDSVGKDDKPITVNLGGSEITTQPVNDTSTHHKVVIKTPSTLTTDKLELSGEGIQVNDVMLFEGGEDVIKQEVDYVEGIQSIGEPVENVFDKSLYYDMVTNYEENISNHYCRTIQLKPNTTYTIYSRYSTLLDRFRICTTKNTGDNIISGSDIVNTEQKHTFTTDSTGKIYAFIVYHVNETNLKNCLDGAKIHIQEGSSFGGYSDYGVPMYQIDIRTSNNYEKLWKEL